MTRSVRRRRAVTAARRRSARSAVTGSKYVYSWSRSYGVDANIAGEIIRHARTPERVLAQASMPSNPLHKCFDWDDTSAARAFRLIQCRTMINSLRIEIVDRSEKPKRIHAFIRRADRVSYVAVPEATREELTDAEKKCWRDMKRFHDRWKSLQFAESVIGSIKMISAAIPRRAKAKQRASP